VAPAAREQGVVFIVTIPQVPGTYEVLGYVIGSGTTLQEAFGRMELDAKSINGWGIVGMNVAIAEETSGDSFIVATGTAITQPR
jgi:uncharacterized protein YbjQ (UPF0145 family)